MDKIREEFEQWDGVTGLQSHYFDGWGEYESSNRQMNWLVWQVAYKSRDEEIKKLRDALEKIKVMIRDYISGVVDPYVVIDSIDDYITKTLKDGES